MANQNIRIRLKAFDHRLIDNSAKEIVETAKRARAPRSVARCRCPPRWRSSRCSWLPMVTRTRADQFELRTHKRLMDILDPTDKTVDALIEARAAGRRGRADQAELIRHAN